ELEGRLDLDRDLAALAMDDRRADHRGGTTGERTHVVRPRPPRRLPFPARLAAARVSGSFRPAAKRHGEARAPLPAGCRTEPLLLVDLTQAETIDRHAVRQHLRNHLAAGGRSRIDRRRPIDRDPRGQARGDPVVEPELLDGAVEL